MSTESPGFLSRGATAVRWPTILPLSGPRASEPALMAGPPGGELDLMSVYPGPIAATHKLRCTDGRFYEHYGDMEGMWSRSIDPGCFDYHLWTPDAMWYFGWQALDGLHWAVPPTFGLPRYWNPAVPYHRESVEYYIHRHSDHDVRLQSLQTLITVESVVEDGDPYYRFYGLMGTESETWWLSPALPIEGGGYAPGMRGALFVKPGGGIVVWEFTEWVPR